MQLHGNENLFEDQNLNIFTEVHNLITKYKHSNQLD